MALMLTEEYCGRLVKVGAERPGVYEPLAVAALLGAARTGCPPRDVVLRGFRSWVEEVARDLGPEAVELLNGEVDALLADFRAGWRVPITGEDVEAEFGAEVQGDEQEAELCLAAD